MEKREILLPSKLFKKSNDADLNIRVGLDESEALLRNGDRDIVLDLAELFNKERQESKNYKIHGKIKMVFRNMYSGSTTYSYLQERLYLNGDGSNNNFDGFLPYNELAFLRNDVVREVTLPSSVTGATLGTYTPIRILTGSTGHTIVTPASAPYHNWNIYLSYAYTGVTDYPMVYTLSGSPKTEFSNIVHFKSGDGIPFRCQQTDRYYIFTSPVEHGMSAGEFIILSGTSITGDITGRTFTINSVGNEIYNSDNYVINILKSQFNTGTTLSGIYLGKRCLDKRNISGTTSQYYIHKLKTLTETKDYILDKIGFESPIWEDERKLLFENSAGVNDFLVVRNRMESLIYDFKEPFVLSGITNNLGFTPTDVYVSILFRNGNGYFDNPPKVGFKFNLHDTWIDEHFYGPTSYETSMTGVTTFTGATVGFSFSGGTALTTGTTLTGAFVEYNRKELKERIISESIHKITNPLTLFDYEQDNDEVFSGATFYNQFGLIYQPHYRIKLRELSPYTEFSKTNDIYNLPENTKYDSEDKVWRWRDLYDHGYIDPDGYGTDFSFLNNIHYVKRDINFYLRNEAYYMNKTDGVAKFKSPEC